MKVLLIAATPFFSDRGSHIRIYNHIEALKEQGIDHLLCSYHIGRTPPGVQVRRSIKIPWYTKKDPGASIHKSYIDLALLFTTLRAYWSYKPDVIYCFGYEALIIGTIIRQITFSHVPLLFDCQGSLPAEFAVYNAGGFLSGTFRWLLSGVEHLLLKMPQEIICSSERTAAALKEKYSLDAERVSVIPDVYNPRFIEKGTQLRAHSRNMLGISPEAKVFVYAGVLSKAKGVNEYLDAIPKLAEAIPGSVFLFIGYGPLQKEYESKLSKLIESGRVHFTGHIPYEQLPLYLSAADYGVDPKRDSTESSGKIPAYQALGLPVFCFATPDNLTAISEGIILISSFEDIVRLYTSAHHSEISARHAARAWREVSEKYAALCGREAGKPKRRALGLIFAIMTAVVIIILAKYLKPESVAASFRAIGSARLGEAFAIYVLLYFARAIRFSVISPVTSVRDNLDVTIVHNFFGNLLPGQIGDVSYPVILKRRFGVAYTRSTAHIISIRLIDFVGVCLLGLSSVIAYHFSLLPAVFLGIIALLYILFFAALAGSLPFLHSIFQREWLLVSRKKLARLMLLSFICVQLMFLFAYILITGAGIHALFPVLVLGWCLSIIGSAIPINGLLGFGFQDAGWVAALSAAGITLSDSLAASVSLHLISLVFATALFVMGGVLRYTRK